ncbi:hypothetical protein GCK32_004452 [Trichostrongylus colubriformis]|uniref:Uncharacterized protein n=1 Tax=Trichostrongylus colubriformis TaxID=6319 RepID=A0AAN8G435_TRICO
MTHKDNTSFCRAEKSLLLKYDMLQEGCRISFEIARRSLRKTLSNRKNEVCSIPSGKLFRPLHRHRILLKDEREEKSQRNRYHECHDGLCLSFRCLSCSSIDVIDTHVVYIFEKSCRYSRFDVPVV